MTTPPASNPLSQNEWVLNSLPSHSIKVVVERHTHIHTYIYSSLGDFGIFLFYRKMANSIALFYLLLGYILDILKPYSMSYQNRHGLKNDWKLW